MLLIAAVIYNWNDLNIVTIFLYNIANKTEIYGVWDFNDCIATYTTQRNNLIEERFINRI